ncbi:MAG: hypothetical protein OCD01_06730 [Fibrobacterales bacterium]
MHYIVRILGVRDKNTLQEMVQIILREKSLTIEKIIAGLKSLPLDIPLETSPEYIVKFKNRLMALSVDLKVIIQETNMPDSEVTFEKNTDSNEPTDGYSSNLTTSEPKIASTSHSDQLIETVSTSKPYKSLHKGTTTVPTTTMPIKKPLSLQRQVLFLILFIAPLIILFFIYTDEEPTPKGVHVPSPTKVVATSMAPIEGIQKADELYKKAINEPSPHKVVLLLTEALEENPYNDSAWDIIIAAYEKNGDYGYAKKAREKKLKQSTSVKKAIQAIAIEFNRRNTRFTINPNQITMDLSHIRSLRLLEGRAEEIYHLLKEQHPNKEITFINTPLKKEITFPNGIPQITPYHN